MIRMTLALRISSHHAKSKRLWIGENTTTASGSSVTANINGSDEHEKL